MYIMYVGFDCNTRETSGLFGNRKCVGNVKDVVQIYACTSCIGWESNLPESRSYLFFVYIIDLQIDPVYYQSEKCIIQALTDGANRYPRIDFV